MAKAHVPWPQEGLDGWLTASLLKIREPHTGSSGLGDRFFL